MAIATHYLQNYAQKFRKPLTGFAPDAQRALKEYSWPGNIRELINAVERAAILCRGDVVEPDDLGLRREIVAKPVKRAPVGFQAIGRSTRLADQPKML